MLRCRAIWSRTRGWNPHAAISCFICFIRTLMSFRQCDGDEHEILDGLLMMNKLSFLATSRPQPPSFSIWVSVSARANREGSSLDGPAEQENLFLLSLGEGEEHRLAKRLIAEPGQCLRPP
ncbi:hypothetical protein B0I37DRAFT_372901 [Chaetomium sp. MPI-CAGE-AT-0009]|nr:hypothetical protein B0I37DRAFT_372901 [Chaetomium sp. MPI-CAGE-AT-0009]